MGYNKFSLNLATVTYRGGVGAEKKTYSLYDT